MSTPDRHYHSKNIPASGYNRLELIIKVRWLSLLLIVGYTFLASAYLYITDATPRLSQLQMWSMVGIFCAVGLYNVLLQLVSARHESNTTFGRTQIILDLLVTTALVHLTGGGSSWLWPMYLVIAIESAFLPNYRYLMALTGILSSILFGTTLLAEYHHVLPGLVLNIFGTHSSHCAPYLWLLWLWVTFLNITALFIGHFAKQMLEAEARELSNREQRLQRFMETAQDLIISFDDQGVIQYLNRAVIDRLKINALSPRLKISELFIEEDRQRWKNKTCRLGSGEQFRSAIFRLNTQDGDTVHVECHIGSDTSGKQPLHWMICRDLTEKLANEQRLREIADNDQLTGLLNRNCYVSHAQQATMLARRARQHLAVALIAIDHLRVINDTLGNHRGDTLLRHFAKRLQDSVRETDIVGRLAGNQFAIMLVNIDNREAVQLVVDKISKRLTAPINIDNNELFITASIGLSLYPRDGSDIEELLKKAGSALLSVKTRGGNNSAFYSIEMDTDISNRLEMINGLHRSMDNNELQLLYQPKVNIATGRFDSVEALLRWSHPVLGRVTPSDFIPMAEESGIIGDLTKWVLRRACTQSKQWQEMGLPPIRIAVNISGHQLQSKDLITYLRNILSETGLDPQFLEIEVTESVLMQNPDAAASVLREMHRLGLHLAIDDFGTGYSSLAYLKKFPINSLKIDRSFIQDIEQSEKYASITASIIEMGKVLKLNIIAEGVETLGQMAFLKEHGCDEVQGYLYSKPVTAEEIVALQDNLKDQTHPISRQAG